MTIFEFINNFFIIKKNVKRFLIFFFLFLDDGKRESIRQ